MLKYGVVVAVVAPLDKWNRVHNRYAGELSRSDLIFFRIDVVLMNLVVDYS